MPSVNWELRVCSRRGHATFAPHEPEVRMVVRIDTPAGEAWRCLRCGVWVAETPAASGPAAEAPSVVRGRALRDSIILRLLAVERILRGVLFVLAGYAILRFRSEQSSLRTLIERDLPTLKPIARDLNIDLDHSSLVRLVHRALAAKGHTLGVLALLLFVYAGLELVEGVGLWMMKRWAEYLTAVATAIFLPLEVYELTEKVTVLRVAALVVNAAAVVYLLLAKRLFGLRGGRTAYDAERFEESLLTMS